MKKLILMGVSLALIAALAVSGTLAYLTDRDSEANVFTVGDVRIDLRENYIQNSQLMPGIDVTKEVTIGNTGTTDAWVWYTYAVPAEADKYLDIEYASSTPWDLPAKSVGSTSIGGTAYNVYLVLYKDVLPPGSETAIAMKTVALDSSIDYDHDKGQYFESKQGTVLDWIDFDFGKTVIYVNAYAIQEENFTDVTAAYEAFLGQWGNGTPGGGVHAMLNPDNFKAPVQP